MSSKAGIGLGTLLSIGDTASPIGYTPVAELNKCTQSGRQAGTADTTNFQSAAREFLPTLIDSGTWAVGGNSISGDAGQIAMEAAFVGLQLHTFKIQLPKSQSQTTTGDSFLFLALVEQLNYDIGVDKAVTFEAQLKVSGILGRTPGS